MENGIPEGPYCYTFTGETFERWNEEIQSKVSVYETEECPFYRHKGGLFGECIKHDCEVMDQVKECGENFE